MNVHANRGWIVGVRMVCASIVAMAGVLAITPGAEAKKKQVDPTELVDDFIADLNSEFASLDASADTVIARVTDELDRAVDKHQLNKVLNSEQKYQNFVNNALRPYEKFVDKGESKVLKKLDKLNADPALSQQVETAVGQAVNQLQLVRSNTEAQVASLIDQAIADIEDDLDDEEIH